ncbi:MAG TPA: TonB-dependent receptor, partial [Myxococcales bacterium LLY-WYZ-16_1]|nr:TonB-dependent receptor [Myxococcales bacterium LLY-WYZ-16_1]
MPLRWSKLLFCVSLWLLPLHALADSKTDARRYFQRGMQLIEDGRYREGIAQLQRAYEIRPHPNVLFNIGRAWAAAEEPKRAIAYFRRYLSYDPPDKAAVQELLQQLRQRQRLRALVDQGMSAVRSGRYLEGVALLKRAHAERPHPNLLFNIARAYEDANRWSEAVVNYRRYLRSDPSDAEAVRRRIRRLEDRIAQARKERTGSGVRAARRQKPEPEPRPKTESQTPPSAPRLDDAQMQALADLLVERLEEEGAFAPAESEADRAAEPETAPPAAGPPPPTALEPTRSSTAAIPQPQVNLQAKTAEVYEDVVVTASRRAQSPLDAPNAVTILTAEDIRLSGARTLPDLLRRVPGVDVMAMSYSDYSVAVRGFNRRIANKVLVLIDGRTAYLDFLGITLWRGFSIDLQDIERVEVVRGPGSAIYGAYAYTGIINIITKRPEDLRGGRAYVAGGNGERFESSLQYGTTLGDLGFRLSAGYERADKYDNEFDPERVDFSTELDDIDESLDIARVDGELDYRVGPGELYLGGGARAGFSEIYGVSSLRNQAVEGVVSNVRAGYRSGLFSFRTYWNGVFADSQPQFFRTGTTNIRSDVESHIVSLEPVLRPEFELWGRHRLVLGGEYRFKAVDWTYLNDEQTENHFALFFQDSWAIEDRFSVIASARLDIHPFIGPLGSPRIAFIYKPTPEQALRLSVGTAFRVPTFAETYLDIEAQTPVSGASLRLVGGFFDLDEERIASVDAGYRYMGSSFDLEAVAYFNRITNLITQTPLQSTGNEASFDSGTDSFVVAESFYVNDPRDFLSLGTELAFRWYAVEGLDVGTSYTFQYIFDEDTGERFTDSPMHKFSIWSQLRTKVGFDAGLSLSLVSDQRWVEPRFDPEDPSGFDTTPLPLDGSAVLMGRVGYRLLDDKLEVGVSGTNLLDIRDNRAEEHPFANRR